MKKQLNTTGIRNELSGASPFFPSTSHPNGNNQPHNTSPEEQTATQERQQPVQEDNRQKASDLASLHASTLAETDHIESTRKTLKLLGKEVIYVRSTLQEKEQIADIVYTLKRQGIKTSDNEICRIAINFLLVEYKADGEQSILAKVLKALHS